MAEKVFVSSSQNDLRSFRDAVREALLSMRMEPIMMEYFEANRASGMLTSLTYVREADIFVLVVGWRYGVPPAGSQHSVTEMEYEAALASAMPLLVFLAGDDTRNDPQRFGFDPRFINTLGTGVESQQALSRLMAFRQRLTTAHVCKFFNTPEQLRAQVSEDLHVTVQRGVKGQRALVDAGNALLRKDYGTSQNLANTALADLPANSPMPEVVLAAAQARFLLAMSLMNGQPPMALSFDTFKKIEALLEQCMALQPDRASYPLVMGNLSQQFGQGAMSALVQKGARLAAAGNALRLDDLDQRNFAWYRSAQP